MSFKTRVMQLRNPNADRLMRKAELATELMRVCRRGHVALRGVKRASTQALCRMGIPAPHSERVHRETTVSRIATPPAPLATTETVAILCDTPNMMRSVQDIYGRGARPDYASIHKTSATLGTVASAHALVNNGVSSLFVDRLKGEGYQVHRSNAWDCDAEVIAWAVRLSGKVDRLVLCAGDGGYTNVVKLLKAVGVRVTVCSVSACCSRRLRQSADSYVEAPVMPTRFLRRASTCGAAKQVVVAA
jgi:uncharacterized LabA/DUF88 family protein